MLNTPTTKVMSDQWQLHLQEKVLRMFEILLNKEWEHSLDTAKKMMGAIAKELNASAQAIEMVVGPDNGYVHLTSNACLAVEELRRKAGLL